VKKSAPAKINLNLRILGKREDGFHELSTLMVPLSLADELTVERAEGAGVELRCDDPDLPVDGGNLVVKALKLFARESGTPGGYRARLVKNIPSGAGLGGGSSDAACALELANALWEQPLTREHLHDLAGQLGSDVPFFLAHEPRLCRGRGEILEPYRGTLPKRVLLVTPPFGVSTPWAYKSYAARKTAGTLAPAEVARLGDLTLVNDLESAVLPKYVILRTLKSWLSAQPGVETALMSGSGSTMFAILSHGAGAEEREKRLREHLAREFGKTFWTRLVEVER
jgi:4-diphosphocytidyl-2-C-methyl-D-erythritol kinase